MNNNALTKEGISQPADALIDARAGDETCDRRLSNLPLRGGVCLKPQHYLEILNSMPDVGWFEIHAENYLGAGGAPLHYLEKICEHYALSIHGVGMSIGSADGIDKNHLKRVKDLVDRFQPASFSEHLAWSTHDNVFYSDLLPVPYNRAVEDIVCEHIDIVQSTMNRQMLLENPSNYLTLESSTMEETEFLGNVIRRTGCGLLLDVNNVYVSAQNCGYSARGYIDAVGVEQVGEIHLAGHSEDRTVAEEILLIDAHDREVAEQVWSLFEYTLELGGARPSLIEWDSSVPEFEILIAEMHKADSAADNTGKKVRANP